MYEEGGRGRWMTSRSDYSSAYRRRVSSFDGEVQRLGAIGQTRAVLVTLDARRFGDRKLQGKTERRLVALWTAAGLTVSLIAANVTRARNGPGVSGRQSTSALPRGGSGIHLVENVTVRQSPAWTALGLFRQHHRAAPDIRDEKSLCKIGNVAARPKPGTVPATRWGGSG
jgi:hypothetical protein